MFVWIFRLIRLRILMAVGRAIVGAFRSRRGRP
ncbi:hypothetical protein BH24ACT26_BH24ACT26_20440 [soil metagenome]